MRKPYTRVYLLTASLYLLTCFFKCTKYGDRNNPKMTLHCAEQVRLLEELVARSHVVQ